MSPTVLAQLYQRYGDNSPVAIKAEIQLLYSELSKPLSAMERFAKEKRVATLQNKLIRVQVTLA